MKLQISSTPALATVYSLQPAAYMHHMCIYYL